MSSEVGVAHAWTLARVDVIGWFFLNWAVPVAGPPLLIIFLRFVGWLPSWGAQATPAVRWPWPSLEESLDVVGWLFVTIATIATALGESSGAHVELGKLAPGIGALIFVSGLYVFTLMAQGAAQQSGGSKVWPAKRFRAFAFVVTIVGAVAAFQIRGSVQEAGGTHANRDADSCKSSVANAGRASGK
jgi:hypothetical protein